MSPSTVRRILDKCFSALSRRDRDRLLYHAENGTPILCGEDSEDFTDGAGGA